MDVHVVLNGFLMDFLWFSLGVLCFSYGCSSVFYWFLWLLLLGFAFASFFFFLGTFGLTLGLVGMFIIIVVFRYYLF